MSKTNLFKVLSLLIVAVLSLGLIACGESDADIAAKVDTLIEELPADITVDDETILLEARDAYDALTAEQKELVTKLADLTAKEKKFLDLKTAGLVVTRINGLPANLVYAHKAVVEQARVAYDALTADQKPLVTNYSKLEDAEEKMADLVADKADQDAAKVVEDLIEALPAIVQLEDEADVVAARTAYDELTEAQQGYVPNLTKLTNAEAEIIKLKEDQKREADKAAAQVVDNQITSLPAIVVINDKAAVQAARAAYEALTADQKAFVTNLVHLQAKETRIADLELAKPVEDLIAALPADVLTTDEAAIVAARTAYNALEAKIKALVTNLDRLVLKEEELIIAKDPDLGAIYKIVKVMPKQIINDYVLPTDDGAITWAYKEGSITDYYNIETGEILKNSFKPVMSTLVATKNEATMEVEVNFGLTYADQTSIFYTGTTKPAGGKTSEGFGTYYTQLEKAGFGGTIVTVGNKVYFLSKNSYIPISGTTENEQISRETLRPHGLSTNEDYNNTGLVNGVPTGYKGAGALYHNNGDVAITFDASDTYGRGNNPQLGFGKMIFKLVDGKLVVQPVLPEHAGNDSTGSTGLHTVTLNPGEYFWTVHSWEVDYGSEGFGTNLNQNHNGVLAPDTVVKVAQFKNLLPQTADEIAVELVKGKIPANIMNDYTLPTLEGLTWALKEGEDTTLYDVATGKLLRFPGVSEKLVVIATYKEVQYEVELNFGIVDPTKTQFYYNANDSDASLKDGTYATQEANAGFGGYTVFVGNKQYFLGKNAYIAISGTTAGQVLTQAELRPYGLADVANYNAGLVTDGVASENSRGYGVLYENTGTVDIKFDLSFTYGRNSYNTAGYGKLVLVPQTDGSYKVTEQLANTGDNTTTTTTADTMFTLKPGEMLWCPHTWERDGTYLYQPQAAPHNNGVLAIDSLIRIIEYKTNFEVTPVE